MHNNAQLILYRRVTFSIHWKIIFSYIINKTKNVLINIILNILWHRISRQLFSLFVHLRIMANLQILKYIFFLIGRVFFKICANKQTNTSSVLIILILYRLSKNKHFSYRIVYFTRRVIRRSMFELPPGLHQFLCGEAMGRG